MHTLFAQAVETGNTLFAPITNPDYGTGTDSNGRPVLWIAGIGIPILLIFFAVRAGVIGHNNRNR